MKLLLDEVGYCWLSCRWFGGLTALRICCSIWSMWPRFACRRELPRLMFADYMSVSENAM